jgi:glc operon protein GlcG
MNRILIALLGLVAGQLVQAADVTPAPTLTLEGAKAVVAQATAHARKVNAPGGAIAIVDAAGNLIYFESLDGSFPAAWGISIGKARTAVAFRRPTRGLEDIINKGRTTMVTLPDVAPFTPLQGGVPIEADGRIVGAIGVSGAASAQQDDEIATAGADGFAKARTQRTSAVTHVPREQVEAGFRKDLTLVAGDTYRVNASRRDGAGEAEVHLRDTDIFYVLEGSATFVTGGEISEPRKVSTDEVRGKALVGGEERRLAQGEVITIPRGTPHWFKSVEAPFTYYVVKSTDRG